MRGIILKTAMLAVVAAATIQAGVTHAAGPDKDRYIVSFQNASKGKSALRSAGADVLLELPNQGAVAARIPARALKGLQRNPILNI